MKKQIKKQSFSPKAMRGIAIANQVFGYLTFGIMLFAIGLFLFLILTVEEDAGNIIFALLAIVYLPPAGAITSLVWIILSIVQCFKFEKVGTAGGISPKSGSIVLGIFLSLGFVVLVISLVLILVENIPVGANEGESILESAYGYALFFLPIPALGQAIFNSIYSCKLKKSL